MFGSAILETVIGTVFMFLTVSIAVTSASELLASAFHWRATNLERSIGRLLDSPVAGIKSDPLLPKFKSHALVQSLVRRAVDFPSYLPASTFSMVVLDLAKVKKAVQAEDIQKSIEDAGLPDHLKQALEVLLNQVRSDLRKELSDLTKFRQGIETWFNDAMDRAGGWYKRRTQVVNVVVAVTLACLMNLDSIDMVQSLSRDTTLRQGITAQAAQLAQKAPPVGQASGSTGSTPEVNSATTYKDLANAIQDIRGLELPMGWSRQWEAIKGLSGETAVVFWFLKVLGLLLTALAASLGAPFWFDVLDKFISIRSSGDPPVPSTVPPAATGGSTGTNQ
jgi:hypothetical protein